jgi:hypothetical protein
MWDYYKRTFVVVQLAAVAVSIMVYRNTNHAWFPPAVFFVAMQVSAVFGAMWANRLRKKMQAYASCAR